MKLNQVSIAYGEHTVIEKISLEINMGEVFVLMGPSGSGKSTILKGIAGLLPLHSGSIGWEKGNGTSGLVFQEPRLFPHMTVLENIAFGLRAKGVPRKERLEKAREFLEILQLQGLGNRFPHQLSGGQQQRVSLGRVLVLKPDLLLLDEPFSSLDTPLRFQLTEWLYQLQRQQGFSILWVTHYLDEAYSVCDRVGLIMDGKIQQVGKPTDFYHYPQSEKIAAFFSLPNRFTLERWQRWLDEFSEQANGVHLPAFSDKDEQQNKMGWIPTKALKLVGQREESFFLNIDPASSVFFVQGSVCRIKHESNRVLVVVDVGGDRLEVELDMLATPPLVGEKVKVAVPYEKIIIYPKE